MGIMAFSWKPGAVFVFANCLCIALNQTRAGSHSVLVTVRYESL